MARYIDADKISYFLSVGDDTPIEGIKIAYKDDIDRLPTADVEEVVRCKDCRNRYEKNWSKCTGRRPDDFCSDGVRRKN